MGISNASCHSLSYNHHLPPIIIIIIIIDTDLTNPFPIAKGLRCIYITHHDQHPLSAFSCPFIPFRCKGLQTRLTNSWAFIYVGLNTCNCTTTMSSKATTIIIKARNNNLSNIVSVFFHDKKSLDVFYY